MTEEGLELGRTTHRAPPTGAAVDAMEHANARAGSPSSAVVSALGSGGLHCIRNVQRADPLGVSAPVSAPSAPGDITGARCPLASGASNVELKLSAATGADDGCTNVPTLPAPAAFASRPSTTLPAGAAADPGLSDIQLRPPPIHPESLDPTLACAHPPSFLSPSPSASCTISTLAVLSSWHPPEQARTATASSTAPASAGPDRHRTCPRARQPVCADSRRRRRLTVPSPSAFPSGSARPPVNPPPLHPTTMEQVHGVDVSWMTHGSPKGKLALCAAPPGRRGDGPHKFNKSASSPPKTPAAAQPRAIPSAATNPRNPQGTVEAASNGDKTNGQPEPSPSNTTPSPGGGIARRLSRSGSIDKQPGPNGTPPGSRRNSWFSSISAKFSSSANTPPSISPQHYHSLHHLQVKEQQQNQQLDGTGPQPQGQNQPPPQSASTPAEPPPPKLHTTRNAVLPHAAKPDGSGPYTPAPPKSSQAGILGVFRRLSSSGGSGQAAAKLGNGLVDRVTLNVDQDRERCPISELKDAKLRRVSFCVDVEIAPMPKYADGDVAQRPAVDRTQKKKLIDKGEGEALKHPRVVEAQKEADEETPKPAAAKPVPVPAPSEPSPPVSAATNGVQENGTSPPDKDKDTTKKKEKKKKSEEERKARKEKRRRLAEDNGSVPIEIHYDTDDSSSENPSGAGTPKPPTTTTHPTTNPARIYRRCCQLRETPILKKITEQLSDSANSSPATGVVNKLDLTDYWLQLPDLITLGDYLAVVPVREIILENCGLSDEGLRKPTHEQEGHGGVVERVVLKNNKLGPDGWKHISLFLYMCRSLKYLDLSHIPFPRQSPACSNGTLPDGRQIPRGIADVFSKALAERLGGSTLEMLNIGETAPSMDQLRIIIEGVTKCGIRRLGLAHNLIDAEGVEVVAKYLAAGMCEGLDLGGNDIREHMETLAGALKEKDPCGR
ncbi:hypothetical protein ACCO45_012913 [Purpureocillium lilacinum]|uniref:Uncharacterized protein n=1 Tax=Purpureocillium lilacinum TaxID=33203 RepID=A0ACC4DCE1_PURLI